MWKSTVAEEMLCKYTSWIIRIFEHKELYINCTFLEINETLKLYF